MFSELNRIPLNTEEGDILYEEKEGKLILRLRNRLPFLDFKDLFTSQEWKALLNKQIVLGEWNPAYRYKDGNIVSYYGELYQSLVSDNLNNLPNEESSYWRKIVQKGQDGISAEELFSLIGGKELRMEITDNAGGVVLLGNGDSTKLELTAKVMIYFKDLSSQVIKWRWRRATGGSNPTLDNMASDKEWDDIHENYNKNKLTITERDLVLPKTTFVCTAHINGQVLESEMKIEL